LTHTLVLKVYVQLLQGVLELRNRRNLTLLADLLVDVPIITGRCIRAVFFFLLRLAFLLVTVPLLLDALAGHLLGLLLGFGLFLGHVRGVVARGVARVTAHLAFDLNRKNQVWRYQNYA